MNYNWTCHVVWCKLPQFSINSSRRSQHHISQWRTCYIRGNIKSSSELKALVLFRTATEEYKITTLPTLYRTVASRTSSITGLKFLSSIRQSAHLSGSTLSENPYRGLFGSSGESHESFSAESLSPAAEIWVIKIALVERGISWPGNRIRSTNISTEFNTTITDKCLYESTHSTVPSLGKPWYEKKKTAFQIVVLVVIDKQL